MKVQAVLFSARAVMVLLLLLAGLPCPAHGQPSADAQAVMLRIPLGRLIGSSALRMEGLYSTAEVEIPTSPGWQLTEDVRFLVKAVYSSSLDPQTSTLTFSVNNTPLAALRLADMKAEGTPVVLPKIRFSSVQNRLVVLARLYLKQDAQCGNWADPARWVEISTESTLELDLTPLERTYTLRDFPAPFQSLEFSAGEFHTIRTTFVLPDETIAGKTTSETLRALAAAAFAFGRSQPDRVIWDLAVRTRADLEAQSAQADNLVFLGDAETSLLQIPDSPGQDSVAILPSPFNPLRAALVFHDASPADSSRPELTLADPDLRVGLSGSFAVLAPAAVRQPSKPGLAKIITLQDLGYNPRTVNGLGVQNLVYRIYLPYPVQIDTADLELDFSHAEAAVPGGSTATVFFNGSTIAKILLTDRTASPDALEMNIPARFFQPGSNYLRITFDLRPAVGTCATQSEAIWATVMNTTNLSLTSHPGAPLPALDDFPQPFNDLEGATLVLPDHPDDATLARAAHLAVLLGQSAEVNAVPPDLITAAAFDPAIHGQRHLIILGALAQNTILRQHNDLLPQPFAVDGARLAPGYGMPDVAFAGLVEVARSPWQSEHRVLAITGSTEADFLRAFDQLLDPGPQKPTVTSIVPVSTPAPAAPLLTGNVLSVQQSAQPENRQVRAYTIHDAGNLPLLGPVLQSVHRPNIYLSLAAIALGLGVLLIMAMGIALYERWKATRPVDHAVLEEPDTK